jgi:excisionase family DNA binding protein
VLILNENINKPWVSTKEIAEHLDIIMITVRTWIKTETSLCSRMGELWKFKRSEVDA